MFPSQYVQPNVTIKCTGRKDRDKLVRLLLYKVNEFAGCTQAHANSPSPMVCSAWVEPSVQRY